MSPKKRPKNRAPNRTSTRRPPATPPPAAQDPGSDELPLPGIFLEIDEALSAPHPLSLLSQASSFMATLDPRENGHPAFSAAPNEDEGAPISLTEVCELIDGCSDALFDEEFRTASRRFLARVAAADPDIFRRKSAAPTAAAVCWVIGRANGSFEPSSGTGVMVKDVMAHFGVGASTTKRADPMLRAIGADSSYGGIDLGAAEMLVSAMRVELIDMRDLYGDAHDD